MKKNILTFEIQSINSDVEVNVEKFLLPFLSPTTNGANYWDSPNEANIKELSVREITRINNQVREIINILEQNNLLNNSKEISLLDVGTGNGMVPKLLSYLERNINATGIDPFLHGGHKTSWQKSDSTRNMDLCIELWKKENNLKRIPLITEHNYQEHKRYLDEHLNLCSKRYKIVYCKAIEHVPNWAEFADQLCEALDNEGLLIIKHRSFFSYLGPHRYSTTGIPWGHCLMNDDEYKKYSKYFHPERSDQMCDFYFNGLSNPRMTLTQLIRRLNSNNLDLLNINITKPKYSKSQFEIINQMPGHIDLVLKNNPLLSYEEMTSGLISIVLKKQK